MIPETRRATGYHTPRRSQPDSHRQRRRPADEVSPPSLDAQARSRRTKIMAHPRTKRATAITWALCILGFGGTAALIVTLGAGDVLGAVASTGWGIAAVAAWRAVPLLVATLGWRAF